MIKKYSQYLKESYFDEDEDMEVEEEPDDFITNQELRKFLIDNNCLEEYIENCENKKLDPACMNYPETFDIRNPVQYISDPFNWTNSPQGHNFWAKLDNKWCMVLKRKKKKK
jgi:hypothetical protein